MDLIEGAERIDCALLLDVDLGGEAIFPAADLSTERRIPFLSAAGYDKSVMRWAASDTIGSRPLPKNPGYLLGKALDASGFFALLIEAAATVDAMTGLDPVKDPLMAAFPDAPRSGQGVRRTGVDPIGKLLGPSAGLISDMSKAADAPIGAAPGDAITDSQAEATKRFVPFQGYIGRRQAIDLLTADE